LTLLGTDYTAGLSSKLPLKDLLVAVGDRFHGDLLVILDQFEEYFLYHPGAGPDTFAREFAQAANHPGLPASFLIALRDDAVSRLDRFKPLIPCLFSNYLRLGHLSAEDARAAMLNPIVRYNDLPENRRGAPGTYSIEPKLVDEVIAQVQAGRVLIGQVGQGSTAAVPSAAVETPFLQLVMTRLWDAEVQQKSCVLRFETLDKLGGAEVIVKGHLEAALSGLSPKEKSYCAAMFPHLVTPSGTKIAHTVVNLARFARVDSPDVISPLLEKLAASERRILAPVAPLDGRPGQLQYEIYHDSLAQAVLSWQARYEADREREARAKEKHRILVYAVAFGIAFLIAAAGGGVAVWQWRVANVERRNARIAEAAALAAKSESDAARLRAEIAEADRNKNLALAQQLGDQLKNKESEADRLRQQATQQSQSPRGQNPDPSNDKILADVIRQRDSLQSQLNALRSNATAVPPARKSSTPSIVAFTASPSDQMAVLTWKVDGSVDRVTLDPGGMPVKPEGSLKVRAAPETYTLTATGGGGKVSRTVQVSAAEPIKIVSFTANSPTGHPSAAISIRHGDYATLSWSVTGSATGVTISPDNFRGANSGSIQVRPDVTTEYTLTPKGVTLESRKVKITVKK
jgi:hypothetical protein